MERRHEVRWAGRCELEGWILAVRDVSFWLCTTFMAFSEDFTEEPTHYRSIINDVFDGQLRSTVKCLTCHHVSETYETFQVLLAFVIDSFHTVTPVLNAWNVYWFTCLHIGKSCKFQDLSLCIPTKEQLEHLANVSHMKNEEIDLSQGKQKVGSCWQIWRFCRTFDSILCLFDNWQCRLLDSYCFLKELLGFVSINDCKCRLCMWAEMLFLQFVFSSNTAF